MATYGLDYNKTPKGARKKPGTVPKDDAMSIRPGTTSKLTREQKRAAASERARIEREARQKIKDQQEALERIQRYEQKIREARQKAGLEEGEEPEVSISSQMLDDMRWVYSQVDGRHKLLEMISSDSKQFAFMIKELIRFETALAEKKAGEAPGSGGFFVVIKGLEDENRLKSAMAGQENEISNQKIKITVPLADETKPAKPATAAKKPKPAPVVDLPSLPARTPDPPPPVIPLTREGEEDW